jgi:outer membrane protein TolC
VGKIFFAFLALFLAGGVLAEKMPATSTSTITLQDILRIAERENPEILAARKKWDAARARIAQETTPDKPRLDIERMYVPQNDGVFAGTGEKNWAVTQEIPFPTTLYLRNRRTKQEAAMAEAGFRAKERDVLARVKTTYAMLFLSHHAIHIFQENVDLMRQFAQAANARYAAGTATQSDVLKAQVELSKMLNMLVTLDQEKQTNEAMLNTLLNRPPENALGVPEDPSLQHLKRNLESLQALAVQSRPELQEAARTVDKSQTSLNLARSEYLPDLMLQYRRRDMTNGPETHDAVVGFSVPLWFWKQGAMVREARADREMAQAEYQFMKNMTLFDVKNLLVKVNTAQRLTELYQTSVLPQAQEALKVSQAGYQSGRIPFLDLLDSSRSLLDFRLEHYQHIADYQQYLADLERVVGVDLGEPK